MLESWSYKLNVGKQGYKKRFTLKKHLTFPLLRLHNVLLFGAIAVIKTTSNRRKSLKKNMKIVFSQSAVL